MNKLIFLLICFFLFSPSFAQESGKQLDKDKDEVKTDKLINSGEISFKAGSWGLISPYLKIQSVLDAKQTVALNMNSTYERADSYRKFRSRDYFQFNPSIIWQPNKETNITLNAGFIYDTRTPERGVINLGPNDKSTIFFLPTNEYYGFRTDRNVVKQFNYSLYFNRKLSDFFELRASFNGLKNGRENTSGTISTLSDVEKTDAYYMRSRSLTHFGADDERSKFRLSLAGNDLLTWQLTHTPIIGMGMDLYSMDFRKYNSQSVDTINVLEGGFGNDLPAGIQSPTFQDVIKANSYNYTFWALDKIAYKQYLQLVLGIRYTLGNSTGNKTVGYISGSSWDPTLAITVSPMRWIDLFASYNTETHLRSTIHLMKDNTPLGASRTQSFQTGIKTSFFNNQLLFNATYFDRLDKNLEYMTYNDAWEPSGYFMKAGNMRFRGVELDLTGRFWNNLNVSIGYTYQKIRYEDTPAYVEYSTPMNRPEHVAHADVLYNINNGVLKGLEFGPKVSYIGARPARDFGIDIAKVPFNFDPYATLGMAVVYGIGKFHIETAFNNITNVRGYSGFYRGGYAIPTTPFNMSAKVIYRF